MSATPHSALVRPPDLSFVDALGQVEGAPAIDFELALAQHRLYVAALEAAGLSVTVLPPAEGLPDACFVQDVALVLPELVLLARPAMPSRQAEIAA
ncbi:MAG: N(G),N(G)-dimethylarginine dimethylaminohydrolase, partial [Anaerolineae bacterium]|nr:N(G),N(G)-dimethylarginine dimethylaminohydrolase [Anaerolineae bacterium]